MIHQQDIRRPLRLPRAIAPDALVTAMRFAVLAPPIRGPWHARGVRLVADDVDFAHGRSPTVHGPGEAVLLAMGRATGRARPCRRRAPASW
ncbi:hypothetical protein [Tsukamurella soli]|uniref:hypothetical protein n=1 Tax=Tsukamurella soli TaxID=644556 RepID=UPI0031E7CD7C